MQITINEAEIKVAIRNHILSQISVNNDMQIDIDFKATRGPEGYTAVIDINPRGTDGKPEVSAPIPPSASKPVQKAEPTVAAKTEAAPKAEVVEENKSDVVEDPKPAGTTGSPEKIISFGRKEEAAPAPTESAPKPSIFAGMNKPKNSAA